MVRKFEREANFSIVGDDNPAGVDSEMKKIPVKAFRQRCLALLDQVQATREAILITRDGKPVAKLVPIDVMRDEIYDFLAGKGAVTGDVVSPAMRPEDWSGLRGLK